MGRVFLRDTYAEPRRRPAAQGDVRRRLPHVPLPEPRAASVRLQSVRQHQ